MEIHADVLLKATKSTTRLRQDPVKHEGATRFNRLTYLDVLSRNLKVMDSTAISLVRDNSSHRGVRPARAR